MIARRQRSGRVSRMLSSILQMAGRSGTSAMTASVSQRSSNTRVWRSLRGERVTNSTFRFSCRLARRRKLVPRYAAMLVSQGMNIRLQMRTCPRLPILFRRRISFLAGRRQREHLSSAPHMLLARVAPTRRRSRWSCRKVSWRPRRSEVALQHRVIASAMTAAHAVARRRTKVARPKGRVVARVAHAP